MSAPSDPAAQGILVDLNRAQREAVVHDQGPLLIVAGAGTGKTTVLTRRIANLIATRRARPEEILALTFTDKAALEMEERVDVLVPYGYADVRISTFHAFGDWLLREHALELGLTPAFRVLSRAEQVLFLRAWLFELPLERFRPLGDPTRHLQALTGLFGRAKDEDVTPEAYLVHAAVLQAEAAAHPDDAERRDLAARTLELARTYAAYHVLMAREGRIDFGDQIVLALRLLRERPYVLAHYQKRFRYVLVDEFQDTNHAQFELVKLLVSRHRNVTVVGDDDQAIFRFRGASMSNILGFEKTYPSARRVVLIKNYRSGQRLLNAAHRLIRYNDPDRLESAHGIDKRLRAGGRRLGPNPVHSVYETVTQEADAVALRIEKEVKRRRRAYRDFAILVRANADADPFLRALKIRGIPWTFSGNQGLYSRPDVRLCIAFLRVLARLDDSVSLHALAGSWLFGVPAVDLLRCATHADRRSQYLFDVLRDLDATPELLAALSPEGAQAIARLLKELERFMGRSAELNTGQLLYEFFADSGWLGRMHRASTAREVAEVQNVGRFFRRIEDAIRILPPDHGHVREFVKHLDALIEVGEDPAVTEADIDVPAVRVLTVHKAKGLEFPVVFVVGLVQGRFPWPSRGDVLELPEALLRDRPSSEAAFRFQEERRLFYVAMTRAKEALHLTSARDYGGRSTRKVSQFVLEALDLSRDAARPVKGRALESLQAFAAPAEAGETEAPLSPDDVLNLSHRQVDDYQTCPLKYRYVHILRIPIRRHHTAVYGETLHRVVEYYLRQRAEGRHTTLENLLKTYDDQWQNEGFLTAAHEAARRAAGREAIERFWHEEEASGTRPTSVEREFRVNLPGAEGRTWIRGRWDRVDETEQGAVIVDYKSSDVREVERADERAAESLQLQIYAMVWREQERAQVQAQAQAQVQVQVQVQEQAGRLPARVELRFLESGVVGRHAPTEEDADAALTAVRTAAEGIRARRFVATPSYQACRYCAYNQICPYTASRGA